jgi:hypothetical protein
MAVNTKALLSAPLNVTAETILQPGRPLAGVPLRHVRSKVTESHAGRNTVTHSKEIKGKVASAFN